MKPNTTTKHPAALDSFLKEFLTAPAKRKEAAIEAARVALTGDDGPRPILVDQATAARMLSCSRITIFRMVRTGELKPVKISGLVRYPVAQLQALAGSGKAA
jgi:hypothetical protein